MGAAVTFCDPHQNLQSSTAYRSSHGHVTEEIEGLIRVHKDGRVERFPVVPEVPCTWTPEPDVVCGDAVLDRSTRVWARFHVPKRPARRPLLIYFHGGGFSVGSAAWACYHRFLARVASQAGCVVMSVSYRLAPEHRLPAAFDDGVAAVKWAKQQASSGADECSGWWRGRCDFSQVFLGGDSAGAAVAHHVAARLGGHGLRGVVLIQPFFGGEERTASERALGQQHGSVLSMAASDTYWRLALPVGAKRDHPWCNPLQAGGGVEDPRLPAALVFAAEMDILRDRNVEVCRAMRRAGRRVECVVHSGVGHAFQVLNTSPIAQEQTQDMIAHIKAFMNR
ncbi:hypothetical protein Taro_008607 [Colocasia esculenta]|uniref:Alpha/beta hydrolase fold-3 domain-containing protein n=1 Tax=Colocasia esculenta TaxID=4460 RepID=A0A843TY21_COLES|nr:hypothetical protein [Colocasia esculenta]